MEEIFKKLALVGDIWVLWILLGASIASVGVIFERAWMFRKHKINFPKFLEELGHKLDKNDALGARLQARSVNSVESKVALAGLTNLSKGPASVEEAMTSRLVLEKSQLEKNLVVLGTLGNNAPFIGLFGTVLGIIKAFNDLAVTGGSGVSVVMAGISAALIATAFGILVAIPAVMANNYFQTKLRRINANSQSLIHLFQVYLQDESHQRLKVRDMEPEAEAVNYMSAAQDTDDGVVTGINVTPLVDIMLVLLIIFMVTAHFVQDSALKVNLPKSTTTDAAPTPALVVSVDDKGLIHLMDNEVDMNGLKANLAREAGLNPGVRVTLAADQDLPYRQVVSILDLIKQAGVTRVALAAQK